MGTNYVKKTRTERLPVVTDTQVNHFSSGAKTEVGSYIYNGIILQYPNGDYYVTQRPAVAVSYEPADIASSDAAGRAVYYWDEAGTGNYVETGYVDPDYVADSATPALYFANLDTIYKDSYSTACSPTISAGTTRMYIKELGSVLVFLDAENNEMWYTLAASATTLYPMQSYSDTSTDITFTAAANSIVTAGAQDFSTLRAGDIIVTTGASTGANNATWTIATVNSTTITVEETGIIVDEAAAASVTIVSTNYSALPQNNSRSLAAGLVVLDQTMYVLATDGTVWGSYVGDVQDWDDAANVLTAEKEEDGGVFIAKHYDNIVVFGKSTIEFLYGAGNAIGSPLSIRADVSYNIGCADANSVWQSGDEIYFLGRNQNGQTQVYVLSEFKLTPISKPNLTSFFNTSGFRYVGSGFTSGGVTYYMLTTASVSGTTNINPIETNVYNTNTQTWTEWEHANGVDRFPLINFTTTSGSSTGYGMFSDGKVFIILDDYDPAEDGYNIEMKIRLDHFDSGSRDWKYAHQLRYVGDATDAPSNITVKWADDSNKTSDYSAGRTIDISDSKNKLTRLGRFKSRSHEISYSGSEQIRIEGLDLDITEGTH